MFRTNSTSQIVFRTDIFRKLTLGAPEHLAPSYIYVVGRWPLLPNQRWVDEIARRTKLHPRGEGWPQSLPFLALRHCSHPYARFSFPFNTERKKKYMVCLGDGVVWSQELRDPLDQPNITFSKHVTPRKKVKTLSHRWNISFSSVL